jgi:hypothetical protein
MTIPDSYIGHKEFLERGIIQEYYPINNDESAERWVQEDILQHYGLDYRVHIVRTDEKNKDFIFNACIRNNIDFKNHTSTVRITSEELTHIFNNISNEESNEEIKLDIDLLDRDKKMQLINDFLERKNIILEENEIKKIENIIDDTEIVLKKYISISKIYQQIVKISFLKKLENGSYIIDLNKSNVKKSKKYFFK